MKDNTMTPKQHLKSETSNIDAYIFEIICNHYSTDIGEHIKKQPNNFICDNVDLEKSLDTTIKIITILENFYHDYQQDQEPLPKFFLDVYFYFRISAAKTAFPIIELMKERTKFEIKNDIEKDITVGVLTNFKSILEQHLPVIIRHLTACETQIKSIATKLHPKFPKVLVSTTKEMFTALSDFYQITSASFLSIDALKQQLQNSNRVKIYQNNEDTFLVNIKKELVTKFTEQCLDKVDTLHPQTFLIYPSSIPFDCFVLHSWLDTKQPIVYLVAITPTNYISFFTFICTLSEYLSSAYHDLEFKIFLSQNRSTLHDFSSVPKLCLDICQKLELLDIKQIIECQSFLPCELMNEMSRPYSSNTEPVVITKSSIFSTEVTFLDFKLFHSLCNQDDANLNNNENSNFEPTFLTSALQRFTSMPIGTLFNQQFYAEGYDNFLICQEKIKKYVIDDPALANLLPNQLAIDELEKRLKGPKIETFFEDSQKLFFLYMKNIKLIGPTLFLKNQLTKNATSKSIQLFYYYHLKLSETFISCTLAIEFKKNLIRGKILEEASSLMKTNQNFLLPVLMLVENNADQIKQNLSGFEILLQKKKELLPKLVESLEKAYAIFGFDTSHMLVQKIKEGLYFKTSLFQSKNTSLLSKPNISVIDELIKRELLPNLNAYGFERCIIFYPTIVPEPLVIYAHFKDKLVFTLFSLNQHSAFFAVAEQLLEQFSTKITSEQRQVVLYTVQTNGGENTALACFKLCQEVEENIKLPYLFDLLSSSILTSDTKEQIVSNKFFVSTYKDLGEAIVNIDVEKTLSKFKTLEIQIYSFNPILFSAAKPSNKKELNLITQLKNKTHLIRALFNVASGQKSLDDFKEIVKLATTHSVLNCQNEAGITALTVAEQHKQWERATYLKTFGAMNEKLEDKFLYFVTEILKTYPYYKRALELTTELQPKNTELDLSIYRKILKELTENQPVAPSEDNYIVLIYFCCQYAKECFKKIDQFAIAFIEKNKNFITEEKIEGLIDDSAKMIEQMSICERKLIYINSAIKINPLFNDLFNNTRLQLLNYLTKLYLTTTSNFISFEQLQRQNKTEIEYFRSNKVKNIVYPDPDTIADLVNTHLLTMTTNQVKILFVSESVMPDCCFVLLVHCNNKNEKHIAMFFPENRFVFINYPPLLAQHLTDKNVRFKLFLCQEPNIVSKNAPSVSQAIANLFVEIDPRYFFGLLPFVNELKSTTKTIPVKKQIGKNSVMEDVTIQNLTLDLLIPIDLKDASEQQQKLILKLKEKTHILDLLIKNIIENESIKKFEIKLNLAVTKKYNVINFAVCEMKQSLLQLALAHQQYKKACLLIKSGADLNFVDKDGKTVRQYFKDSLTEAIVFSKQLLPKELETLFSEEIHQFTQDFLATQKSNIKKSDKVANTQKFRLTTNFTLKPTTIIDKSFETLLETMKNNQNNDQESPDEESDVICSFGTNKNK